jgi:LysM repeat protein
MRRVLCALWLATAGLTLGLALAGCVSEEAPVLPMRTPAAPPLVRPPSPNSLANPTPSPFASPVLPASQSYTVRPGDSLSSVAAEVYGDASQWRRIFEANRDQLGSPEELRAGMTIRIPPRPQTGSPYGDPNRPVSTGLGIFSPPAFQGASPTADHRSYRELLSSHGFL